MIIEFFLLFIFFSSPFENKIWNRANTIFKNMIQSCCLMKPVRHKIIMFPFRCNATMTISLFDSYIALCYYLLYQDRSQELEMEGAKSLGEGSGGRLRPPVGPGQALVGGPGGQKPTGSSRVLKFNK